PRAAESEMARGIVGQASRLRPVLIVDRRRKHDGGAGVGELARDDGVLLRHHRNALARQRHGLFGEGVDVVELGQRRAVGTTAEQGENRKARADLDLPPDPTPHAAPLTSSLRPAGPRWACPSTEPAYPAR